MPTPPTAWLPPQLRRVSEMLIAVVALCVLGVAVQSWVDSRAHAAVDTHVAGETARWDSLKEDISEIKADVKEIKREVKIP